MGMLPRGGCCPSKIRCAILLLVLMVINPHLFKAFRSISISRRSSNPRHRRCITPPFRHIAMMAATNRELAELRLEAFQKKKDAIKDSIDRTNERNFQLKRMLHSSSASEAAGAPVVPKMYQVKVTVCEKLREELKLSGREKRGRVFLEKDNDAVHSMKGLLRELHGFFRALRKGTFVLAAAYPAVTTDGKVVGSGDNATLASDSLWSIESDDDVVRTFERADVFFEEASGALKRPAIEIRVRKDPNAPPPPPPPAYLENMPDPANTTHISMLSFYSFPSTGIADPELFAAQLRKLFRPFSALGRIYVAAEGVNAQMSVPTNVLDNFRECCNCLPDDVGTYLVENGGINVDSIPLTVDEFRVAGVPATAGVPAPPFKNLHIRIRQQVVADGLANPLDWQQAGYDMPALEWHEKLKVEKKLREENGESEREEGITLLDCRNTYETDVGIFEGAEPLNTLSFRDSWDALKERLADTPKDAPIMTYCTGGIRCVKVGAYLTQELGFTNVSRLAGGIIAYDRTLTEEAPEEEPMFKGTNFVFDGRLGRSITEDALGTCLTCESETSMVSNCRNPNCHKRIVQCEDCRTSFQGTCSDACRHRLVNGSMLPRRRSELSLQYDVAQDAEVARPDTNPVFRTLDEYSEGHSSPLSSIYNEMELNTKALIPSGSHMTSGASQGRLLTQFASMTREGRVLELGTFTGYATACLLEGAANAGRALDTRIIGSREGGPFVMTMERDTKAFEVAVAQLKVVAQHGTGEAGAEAVCALRGSAVVPVVPEDSISVEFDGIATCELVKVSDALAAVEAMCAGCGDMQPAPFDLVFLDADKTRLLEYVNALVSSDRVLKKGGLVIVDNVLWKGLVIEASSGEFSSLQEFADSEEAELRKNRRARKLANKMHRFNSDIVKDDRVDVLVLPMRDGLSVIRKK